MLADATVAPEVTPGELGWTPPSWDEVVREHADRVYRLAYRLTGNPHDAEDLTQETFIRVFRSLASYKPGTFEGWLHRITTNLFLDMARRRSRVRMEGLPDEEIGATLGVKLGTVRSRIHRGRQALRASLERRRAMERESVEASV